MKRLTVIALTLLVAACASSPSKMDYYAAPAGTTAESGAEVIGSRISRSFPYADHTAYVFAVDGKPTDRSESRFAQPVLLAPGSHLVGVAWVANEIGGKGYLKLSVNPGDKIVLKQGTGKDIPGDVAQLWFENQATGVVVSESAFVKLARLTSTTFIPVFIPSR